MLQAVVLDMASSQTSDQKEEKSEGRSSGESSDGIDSAALAHAASRVESGFDIVKLVAEFRALRAAVNRIWAESFPSADAEQIDEMLRFNEGIDQLVAVSVSGFSDRIDRSRRIFLGIIGHDMRQPLHTLNILVEMLGHSGSTETVTVRNQMKSATSQLAALLSDLLDFNTAQVGSCMQLRREPSSLAFIGEHLVAGFRIAHPTKDFKLETDGDLLGQWDNTRMRQMITNLVSNAVAYGTEKSVQVNLRGSTDSVVIEVRNWGSPIPSEAIPTLFNPLVRLGKEEVLRPQGSVGLGLYICREIAHAHAGTIRIESSLSEGTAFIVEVPKTAQEKSKK